MITLVMLLYYGITAFTAVLLGWIFFKEKEDRETMVLCLIVLVPLVLRLLRLK